MSVADNLARIRESIGARPVKLIAVTKYVGTGEMAEAIASGVTEFGENRVQDALEKQSQLAGSPVGSARWHLIGHLQTNKARDAVALFDVICPRREAKKLTGRQLPLKAGSPAEIIQGVSVASTIVIETKIGVFQHRVMGGSSSAEADRIGQDQEEET